MRNTGEMQGVYFAQYEYSSFPGDGGFNLGVFTTIEKATEHVAHVSSQPGFANVPNRFSVEFWALDRTVWESGFAFPEREHGPDVPLWAKRLRPADGERAKAYAKRLCDQRFGRGQYHLGPTSEYAQLKKRVPGSRPGIESNRASPQRTNGAARKAFVWELAHEHEFRDAAGNYSDQAKFLGFFASQKKARDVQRVLASKPGFRDTQAGFSCGQAAVDVGFWCEGFV